MNDSFGNILRITSFGESHGPAVGVVLEGCPAGLRLDMAQLQQEMARRRPGQSALTTSRQEADEVEILSGVFEGQTTGAPIALVIRNRHARPADYHHLADTYRPSHADYTYQVKYGLRDYRGGGRASARITAGWVAAGAIAKQLLAPLGIKIAAYVSQVGTIKLPETYSAAQLEGRQEDEVRCPDAQISQQMADAIKEARKQGDTLGGVVSCSVSGVPAGLGEPVFNKLHAQLGKAMLSINAVKGFEYGSGFAGAAMRGSEHNDIFTKTEDGISTRTNYSGGIQGGISNGQEIYFRVAFKPVATIMQDQPGIDQAGRPTTVQGKGRHDPCVVPRAVPIVEAMTALVLADFVLMNQTAKLGG